MPETDAETTSSRRKSSDPWLMRGLRLNVEAVIGNAGHIPVEGRENLEAVIGKPLILVTTHLSDVDVQLGALTAGNQLDIVMTNQTTQHEKSELLLRGAMTLMGRENFIPVGWARDDQNKPIPYFDPADFSRVMKAVDSGRVPAIAAHNPVFDGKLPDHPGYLAAGLAQKILGSGKEVWILPVAVVLDGPVPEGNSPLAAVKARNHTTARVVIGPAFIPENTFTGHVSGGENGLDRFLDLIRKHNLATPQEKEERKQLRQCLNAGAAQIMSKLAHLLPPERRGKWG